MAAPITTQDLLNALNNLAGLVTTLAGQQQTMQTAITNMANHLANFQAGPPLIIHVAASQITIPANISSAKIVEKPAKYDGKDSEKARQFRNAFLIWVQNNMSTFCIRNANGQPILNAQNRQQIDSTKAITSIFSFMKGDAAVWARPHLETIANGQTVFNDDWDTFIAAFKAKFEPIDEQSDARL